ncbi:MarR family winged helix-turn-helix transcriptional regulator [Neptuniibacter halophilus]|uniref:MarR family winged helix-turn-helix transcriptional regulator n=1 Tax=Neptuniibacter halophilus TaxID=651666 RepID=UPI002572D1D1|nr:MarR family transcriptional regulator [Neptuniibacter halophilus]
MRYELQEVEIVQALLKRPGFMMRRGFYETRNFFEKACEKTGLTAQQYDVLFILSFVDHMPQSNIGRLLDLDKSTTGLVIKKLIAKGYIERKTMPSDTRQRLVRLTAEGRSAFAEALLAAKGSQERIINILGEEDYEQLLALLAKVVRGMDRETNPPEEEWPQES